MATAQDILQWLIWMSACALPAVAIATGVQPVQHLKNLHFTQPAYNATIPENAVGKTFVTPSTKMGMYLPLDDPPKVTYQIIGSYEDLFKVESYVLGDFCFLLVRTNSGSYGKLNREFQSLYQLKIQATAKDNSGSVYQTFADLSIFVSDLNDLSPIFDHKNYEAIVREDTPLHSSILKVSAYDGDEGINAEIYYSFVQKTNMFAIHPTTGIVTLTRPLNFVLQDTYSLEVMAEDRGLKQAQDSSKIRTTKLTIQVEQANFFSPEIGINHLPSLEEREAGTVAAIVSVIDRDMGLNGKVDSLQIIEGNKEGLFSVVPGNQKGESLIVLNKSLSRKHSYGSFNLTLTVSDMGRPPRSSNATLFINVLDFYNNRPIFTKATYNISVEEIVPRGTPLLHLGPTSSTFNRIRHMLRITNGDEHGLFEIRNNGLLSTTSKLDADEVDYFELEISAFDGQIDEKHKIGSARVQIFVLDCNDNSPIFMNLESDTSVSVMENVPIGYQVFHVTASDKDKGENGLISYSITNSDSVPFEIDPFTGIIKTKQLLDYETSRRHYLLRVRASDWGTPFAQEVESFVTVHLLDQNDNTPKFEKINCTGFLSRDAPLNMELLVTSAIDLDISNLISYRIWSGNADDCFTLDPTTAKLVLRCPLKNDPNDVKRVQIIATDGEHNSEPVMIEITLLNVKHSTHLANSNVIKCQDTNIAWQLQEQVTISRKNNIELPATISNNNDHQKNQHPPKFLDNSPSSVDVSEKASVGSPVLTMLATDEDSGYSGLLVYVIKEGDPGGHFKIDTRTGQIVVAAELDRELRDTYELVIEVSDLGSPVLSANATLSVTIWDENDNAPVFERNEYEASISENIVVNATVTQVHASDMDIGKNAEIVYSIVSDTNFYIYPQSGIITVNKVLDREIRQIYTVLVRASDKGEISLSSTAAVAITLTDVNDNVPKFVTEIYSVRIREDLPIGTVVNTVTAEDLDLGSNGEVLYKLVYGDDYFEIDEETGTIRIAQRLDYETRQVHNISVRAQDGGNPPLTSTCFINVEIVDVNENLYPPEFDSFFAQGYVNENEPVGTTVMFIHARDPDSSEEDDLITYSLRDGSGLGRFTIDQNGKAIQYFPYNQVKVVYNLAYEVCFIK
ncbi:hypothetical protein ACJMK2_031480 [Sinanodonta woodiana]|uniref:Cadherin domain-containing protein n=1 Tax=Sinanodonta woodiana TaxID=1069815 RepID=A0ABD3WYX2_SINWO